jgi:1,4-dihydroxy-2-naphthoate octaprenyltransferase
VRTWVEAARPRTLPAAIVPVVVGTAAGGVFAPWRFAGALVVALALQVAVNYANDYFDGVRGVDTPDRVGPRRAVASGLVAPARMKVAIAVALGVAALAGLALTVAVGPELLLVGAASILAALAYSGGPRPYASAGLGEVFVFVFFGPVATIGTTYALSETIPSLAEWISIPVGMLAAAILVVNNLRDVETDAAAGKRTLAVRLGPRATRWLYAILVLGAIVAATATAAWFDLRWPYMLVPLGLSIVVAVKVFRYDGRELIPCLGLTALVHLLFGATTALVLSWS